MRRFTSVRGAGAVGMLLGLASAAIAQELPQPTEAHKQMAREAGEWEGQSRFWPVPGAPAVESSCTETCEMLGGFWLVSEFKGDFGGMPFTGRSQLGYDPETGEYVSTWVDSMAPALFTSRGGYDVTSHTLTLLGEGKDWMTGELKQMKLVVRYVDDDHKHFEIHEAPAGSDEWHKSMEIDYTRRK